MMVKGVLKCTSLIDLSQNFNFIPMLRWNRRGFNHSFHVPSVICRISSQVGGVNRSFPWVLSYFAWSYVEISQLLDKRGEYSFVDLYSNFVGQTAIFTIILSQVIRYECFFMSSSKKSLLWDRVHHGWSYSVWSFLILTKCYSQRINLYSFWLL